LNGLFANNKSNKNNYIIRIKREGRIQEIWEYSCGYTDAAEK
jgi:hypothetical protein